MKKGVFVMAFVLGVLFLNGLADRLGVGSSSGLSGNFPATLSGIYWVQAYDAWLKKDKEMLLDNYSFATALNPRNLAYWRLAAQTIAYDFPAWDTCSKREDYGLEALTFFEKSRAYFQDDPEWFLTAGFLAETALGNPSMALQYLREAVALPGFSFRIGRNYARLLIQNQELETAHAFLISWNEKLQRDFEHSEIDQWITELEKQLKRPSAY